MLVYRVGSIGLPFLPCIVLLNKLDRAWECSLDHELFFSRHTPGIFKASFGPMMLSKQYCTMLVHFCSQFSRLRTFELYMF
jgi:hypothetical protein